MTLIAFVASLVALWMVWRARARITALEAEVRRLAQLAGGAAPAEAPGIAPEPAVPPAAAPEPESEPAADRPRGWGPGPRPPVQAGPGLGERLAGWLRDNWIYPAAGSALVLSGLFLVQYAVETGLLTPEARVVLALLLGAALVLGGEALRRRPAAGTILPATLTGAGLVVAMLAVLAALHLYAMIEPAAALIALALLSFLAIALGWLHGPMLAALGLAAGSAAPFALGGGGPPPPAIFGYFAALALAGLGIDAARRWGWVTWLALAGPLAGAVLWRLAGGDAVAFAMALVLVVAVAMTAPFGKVVPVAEGARALSRGAPLPGVRASFAASIVLAVAAALLMPGWEAPVALVALAVLAAVWACRAPALADQMALPVLALPAWVVWQALTYGPLVLDFAAFRAPETGPPLQPTILVALAALAGLAMIWRGEAEAPGRHAPWTLAGLLMPFGTIAALETTWQPAQALGVPFWAAHAMALAALATALAVRYGARDAGQGPRLGAAAAMAFALIALALMLVLGKAALTGALAVLMVAAAAMDRRFDIPGLGLFLVLAALALVWRLVLNPGLPWHLAEGSDAEALAAVLASLGGPLAALWLIRALPDDPLRRAARLIVETGLAVSAAVGAGVAIVRLLPDGIDDHAQLGLEASVLIALAWAQVRRMALPGGRRLRQGLAWLFGLAAGLLLALGLIVVSPLSDNSLLYSQVTGWPVLNDLIPAYLLPGLLLVRLAGWRWLRTAGWALAAVWAALAIRHLWQGPNLSLGRGVEQGELYAYTVALLLAGAVLVARAVQLVRPDLRRLGLTLVALAAAKAFLIDASGLEGLLRAGAFLALGLSLAGLAWVNGWAVAREHRAPPEDPKVR